MGSVVSSIVVVFVNRTLTTLENSMVCYYSLIISIFLKKNMNLTMESENNTTTRQAVLSISLILVAGVSNLA